MVTGCPCPPGWPATLPPSPLHWLRPPAGTDHSVRSRGLAGRDVSWGSPTLRGCSACAHPDRSRAILVVTVDGELAVAVRDAVPRRHGRDSRRALRRRRRDRGRLPSLAVDGRRQRGHADTRPGLASCANGRCSTYWLGAAPAGLPGHARCFDRPAALLDAVRGACAANVGGMHLAPGSGVELGDGTLLRGARRSSRW